MQPYLNTWGLGEFEIVTQNRDPGLGFEKRLRIVYMRLRKHGKEYSIALLIR